jgi:hypothetical protein
MQLGSAVGAHPERILPPPSNTCDGNFKGIHIFQSHWNSLGGSYEGVESALRKFILDSLTKEEQQKQQHHISILPSCDPDDGPVSR